MSPSNSETDSLRSVIPPTPESDTAACSPPTPDRFFSPPETQNETQPTVPQKRKAGRKPLYKTAQERRDRNRRAQLAFRARRSDYLARLEETCRSLEEVVVELQESTRAAHDALNRERAKVKYLERLLQSSSSLAMRQQAIPMMFASSSAFCVSPDNSSSTILPVQGVGAHIFPQDHSLMSLEQQFSPTTQSASLSPENTLFFPEPCLGQAPGFPDSRAHSLASVTDPFPQQPQPVANLEYNSPSASSPSPCLNLES